MLESKLGCIRFYDIFVFEATASRSVANIMKLFTYVISEFSKLLIAGRPFQPSLLFVKSRGQCYKLLSVIYIF